MSRNRYNSAPDHGQSIAYRVLRYAILNVVSAPLSLTVSAAEAGRRLDHLLVDRLPQYSRARLQSWAKEGRVLVNGQAAKPSLVLRGGEELLVSPADLPPLKAEAEDLPLTILYEDADVIAIDKPAGMVVHAGAGVHQGTLVNALLHRFGQLSAVGGDERPGIVHRLDRYTSGVLLVARNDQAHRYLAAQFSGRTVRKTYLTMVQGHLAQQHGVIDKPIARDPVHRTRMTAKLARGRSAHTEYDVEKTFRCCSFLRVRIGTGRTHQIRVHLASIGHPVVGDVLYGAARQLDTLPPLSHYFLHAHEIEFQRPSDGAQLRITSPLAPELQRWMEQLQ